MIRGLRRVFLPVILLCASCSDPTGVSSEGVRAEVTSSSVVITNTGSEPISYIVLDRATAARTLWEPCAWEGCPLVEPGDHVDLRLAEFLQHRESNELIVYWWHIVASPGDGYRADAIRYLVVPY